MQIFNITLPCDKNCSVEYAKAVNCILDVEQNLIVMRFDFWVTQPKVHVWAVDAFTTVFVNESSKQLGYNECWPKTCHSKNRF